MAESIIIVDGEEAIVDDGRRNTTFYLSNLFKYRFIDIGGGEVVRGDGKYVPIVNDQVYDNPQGEYWVTRVDPVTYVAELKRRMTDDSTGIDLTRDKFLSTGSGYASESWRLYVDTTVIPYSAIVDGGFRTYHEDATVMKIFEGIDTSESGTVVSAYYDQSGTYVSQDIPLVVTGTYEVDGNSVEVPVNNIAIKAPKRGYVTKALKNGDIVTAVFYNSEGMPLKVATMMVHRSNAIRKPSAGSKRVVGIQLITNWLNPNEPNVLRIPLNVTVSTVGMMAKVLYSDGTSSPAMAVGNERSTSRFKLLNLEYWDPNVTGTVPHNVLLTYTLNHDEEYSYSQGETANGQVTEKYRLIAEPIRDTYNLKLFVFPSYKDGITGYVLEGWMYDMSRQVAYRVPTNAMQLQEGYPSFNGLDYASVQHLRFSIPMNQLAPAFGTYRHTQNVQVALLRDGVHPPTNWRVKQTGSQQYWYGDNLEAKIRPHQTPYLSLIDISSGFTEQETWLEALFYRLDPLHDGRTESRAPRPTHFIITTKTREIEFPIEAWSQQNLIQNDVTMGGTIYIKWIRRVSDITLNLGVTGLPLHSV